MHDGVSTEFSGSSVCTKPDTKHDIKPNVELDANFVGDNDEYTFIPVDELLA